MIVICLDSNSPFSDKSTNKQSPYDKAAKGKRLPVSLFPCNSDF